MGTYTIGIIQNLKSLFGKINIGVRVIMVFHKYLAKGQCVATQKNPAKREEKYYNHNLTNCVDTILHQTIQSSPLQSSKLKTTILLE